LSINAGTLRVRWLLGFAPAILVFAVGVGGAPCGHLDEQCALSGIEKVKELLK